MPDEKIFLEKASKRIKKIYESHKCQPDQFVEISLSGHSIMEESDGYHDVNEETAKIIAKHLEKAKSNSKSPDYVFAAVVSEANIVTRNRTLYSYEVLNNAITDKEFKRCMKNKEIKFLADHPSYDWLAGEEGNSTLKESAVLVDVFWEKKDEEPMSNDGTIEKILQSKTPPKTPPKTNGSPAYRLFAIFQLVGQYKEHFRDIIENSRLGISSRGYGVSENVVWESQPNINGETERLFLYKELLGLELETWDFVTKPSVPSASVSKKDDYNKESTVVDSEVIPEKLNNSYHVTVNETDNCSELINDKEDSMSYEELLRMLKETPEGVRATEAIQNEMNKNNKLGELEANLNGLTNQLTEKEKLVESLEIEKNSVIQANEMMKAELIKLQEKLSAFEKAEFENYKNNFYAQWNDETATKLKEDLEKCADVNSFKEKAELAAKYIPESMKKNYVPQTVGTKLESEGTRTPLPHETAMVEHMKQQEAEVKTTNDEDAFYVEMVKRTQGRV